MTFESQRSVVAVSGKTIGPDFDPSTPTTSKEFSLQEYLFEIIASLFMSSFDTFKT